MRKQNQTEVWMTGKNHPEKDLEGSRRVLGGQPSGRKEFGAVKGLKCYGVVWMGVGWEIDCSSFEE